MSSLYIVATPIGHRNDITLRALALLKTVDLIAAEDTRHSKKLLDYHDITTPLLSLHDHNESARAPILCDKLKQGQSIALISDAGTPLISDPGYRLVTAVRQAGIDVVPIPGACAAIAALATSGLPTDRFIFEGFLPAKGQARDKKLQALVTEPRTLIFYESVHRIVNLLDLLCDYFGGEREACIAREMTKTFETINTGTLAQLRDNLVNHPEQKKGEYVVLVHGHCVNQQELKPDDQRLLQLLLNELSLKKAVSLVSSISGTSKKTLYAQALALKGTSSNPLAADLE